MTELEGILMERDGLTREEAAQQRLELKNELYELLEYEPDNINAAEEVLAEVGLEPDYIFDIM